MNVLVHTGDWVTGKLVNTGLTQVVNVRAKDLADWKTNGTVTGLDQLGGAVSIPYSRVLCINYNGPRPIPYRLQPSIP
jgi:hypothetical protein